MSQLIFSLLAVWKNVGDFVPSHYFPIWTSSGETWKGLQLWPWRTSFLLYLSSQDQYQKSASTKSRLVKLRSNLGDLIIFLLSDALACEKRPHLVQKLIPAVYFWIYSFSLEDHQRSPAQLTGVADELHLMCNTTHAVFLLLELDKSAHHRFKPVSALPVKVKLRNSDLLNREPVQTSCPWITGQSTARAHDIRAKSTNQCSVRIQSYRTLRATPAHLSHHASISVITKHFYVNM